ncbi:MAG: ABC transporter ATP-binding protein [Acidobacteria bacterium]|nr:ABC transporter ATP-binding protein [Acidobacteriota bacterium]
MIVHAQNLTKKFGETEVVRGINFHVKPGECFGILGPNGAGKTTTMRMIYCASPFTSGALTVFDLDVRRHPRQIKARLGVVPQDNNLDDDLRVIENLITYARYFGISGSEARRRAALLLDFVQLQDKTFERTPTLSGGMKRRLILARSLINHPQLLVLDEPTTGLDPQARRLVWQKLRSLKESGTTIVLTTHYMEDAEQVCDRVAIMDLGRIILTGNPVQLVGELVGTECHELEPAPGTDGMLDQRLSQAGVAFHKLGETYYIFPGSEIGGYKIDDVPHRRLLHRRATLEDLFLKLTGKELTKTDE